MNGPNFNILSIIAISSKEFVKLLQNILLMAIVKSLIYYLVKPFFQV